MSRVSGLIEDIIGNLDADTIQMKYVVLARITDFNGNDRMIEGSELEEVLRGPDRTPLRSAQLVLDVRSLKIAMLTEVGEIFDALDARLAEDHKRK